MYAHMHTLIHIVFLFILPRLCYFCAHSTMYTVKVGCMRYAWASTSTITCACASTARSLSSLARKAARDRGSYASLIVTYTRCYLQCECYRRFCAVVRPFVSGFWRNCGVTWCKIAQNSCAKSRKIAAIAWYTT